GPDTVVVVPEEIDGLKVTEIYKHGFSSNDNLVAVKLPLTVKNIAYYAFCTDSNLTFVTGLDNVEKLADGAFGVTGPLHAEFTDSVTEIEEAVIFSGEKKYLRFKKDSYIANIGEHPWYAPEKHDIEYYE
ncbi:MAG: leucine-rich repeat protein, partial [Coprococcus sp.]